MPRTVTALLFLFLLSACGQSGDLYLPDETTAAPTPPATSAPDDSAADPAEAEKPKESR